MASAQFVSTAFKKDGEFKVRNRDRFARFLAALPKECELTFTVERAHATRTPEMNALYWAGYVNPLAEHTGYTPLEMHAYLKRRFLPKQHLLIQDKQGVVVDEMDLDALTTTTLNKVQFSEYLIEIEAFALTLGVIVGSNREAA